MPKGTVLLVMRENSISDSRNQTRIPNFAGLFGVLFLLLTGLIFINSGIFVLQEVTVQGNQKVAAEDILRSAHLNLYRNIFQIDYQKTKQAILQNPYIASVKITPVLPHKLIITIRERKAGCFLSFANNLVLVSQDGVFLGLKADNESIGLPVITGINIQQIRFGTTVADPRFQLAMTIMKLTDEDITPFISEINLRTFQLSLVLPNSHHSIEVDLGNSQQLPQKIANLRAILSHVTPDELSKIDLRSIEFPTVISNPPKTTSK